MEVKDEAEANAKTGSGLPTRTMESGKRQVKLLGVKKNYTARLTLCLGHWMTVSDLTKPSFACIQKAT